MFLEYLSLQVIVNVVKVRLDKVEEWRVEFQWRYGESQYKK